MAHVAVIGAAAGASCFGPAYEFAMIIDADLRKRKIRDRVPMRYVTSEPYIGHTGLGGVGDSKGLRESEKTGYMIESMISAICENLVAEIAGKPATAQATWNAICLADFGDTTGAAFVVPPEIPPRNVTWAKFGKWVHLARTAFEKYFLRKVRTGSVTPVYERYVLKAPGIVPLKEVV